MHKIAVGLTSNNYHVHWVTLISMMQLVSGRDMSQYRFTPLPECGMYIEVNRNNIATAFLDDTDCDYLWFLDFDNGFYPDALDLFMEDMARDDIDIVSGLYMQKSKIERWNAGVRLDTYSAGWEMLTRDSHLFPDYPVCLTTEYGSTSGLVPTGLLMIKRHVFEHVAFPWFSTATYRDGFLGEDCHFAEEAQRAGFKVWIDPRIRSPHMHGDRCWPPEWKTYECCTPKEF